KTLQDRPRLLPTRSTTVHFLVTCRPSSYLPDTRLPVERHVSTLTAAAVLVRFEVDHDLHVVLRAAGETMIAEAPNSACVLRATPLRRRQIAAARRNAAICRRPRVTGVAFFDSTTARPESPRTRSSCTRFSRFDASLNGRGDAVGRSSRDHKRSTDRVRG